MALKTFRVPAGKEATLSLARSEEIGAQRVPLRPKSPAALQLLFGIRPPKPLRLSDAKSFERPSITKGLVELRPDKAGMINGVKATTLHRIVRSLPDQARMPDSVQWVGKRREWVTAAGQPLPKGKKEDRMRLQAQESSQVGLQQVALLDWISKLRLYRLSLLFLDIIVERNATLHIDHSLIQARNFLIYPGGRVVQDVASLAVDLSGSLHGDVN